MSSYTFYLLNLYFISCNISSVFLSLNSRLASSTILIFKILIFYFVVLFIVIRRNWTSIIKQSFPCMDIFFEGNTTISFILNLLWVIDLSLILCNTCGGTYSIPKESKYTVLSINNEAQCVHLLLLSSRFVTYAPSFILGKLFLEKMPLNLGS